MHAVWTRLRRLVASVMLVAMASFVLHGGAVVAMHQHGGAEHDCGSHASSASHGAATDHVNLEPSGHSHGIDEAHEHLPAGGGDHGHKGASTDVCCGSLCAIAISMTPPGAAWAPIAAAPVPLPEAAERADARPDGPKRPPRTPSIA